MIVEPYPDEVGLTAELGRFIDRKPSSEVPRRGGVYERVRLRAPFQGNNGYLTSAILEAHAPPTLSVNLSGSTENHQELIPKKYTACMLLSSGMPVLSK